MRPRSDGWTDERLTAFRRAQQDILDMDEATRDDRRAERRSARLEAVERAIAPLNKRILHSRLSWRRSRAKARQARKARKMNRAVR
jgi:hypothetical protein